MTTYAAWLIVTFVSWRAEHRAIKGSRPGRGVTASTTSGGLSAVRQGEGGTAAPVSSVEPHRVNTQNGDGWVGAHDAVAVRR